MFHPTESEEDVLHHNLMVNYLPAAMGSDGLRALFERFGAVKECIVICDPKTEQSRGYGFVRFTCRADAENAMAEMNGLEVEGKRLAVKKGDVGKDVDGASSVYVAGFQHRAGVARDLRRIFGEYGMVLDVTLLNPQEGKQGVAFVKFARYADAISAVEKVKEYRKQPLTVKIASQTAKRATNYQRVAKDYDDTVVLAQHTCVPQSDRNVLILYHYPTADGILAALAAHLYFKHSHPELTVRDIAMIPHAVYRPSPNPERLPINRRMTDVFLLGYAGSPDYVQQLAHECNSVTILDHHGAARDLFASMQEDKALPPSVEVVVDVDRSAATLAWDYFGEKANGSLLGAGATEAQMAKLRRLFEYSEDHTLGHHYLPGSRAFAYALQKENLNFNVLENNGIWRMLLDLSVPELIVKGETMLATHPALATILDKSFVIQIRDPHDPEHGHFGQCLAVLTDHPEGIAEMAYRLAVKSAESGLRAIGAVAFQKLGDATCKVTLRAVNNTDEDTLQIADAFHGSSVPRGNAGASSFSVPVDMFQGWVVGSTPAPAMPRNLGPTANQLTLQYQISKPEVYDGVLLEVSPTYFELALGTSQAFDSLSAPPLLVQNMRAVGFTQCPQVTASVYPIQVHRDVLCLLPRRQSAEHVYLFMSFMGLLRHVDPAITRLHTVVLCSTIPLAQHVYMVAQAYSKGTGAQISCVVEPIPKGAPGGFLDCHMLISTPNAMAALCRQGDINLAYVKMVMIHDADRIIQMFLKRDLVEVLTRIWAVRKRPGVTVGMYATGAFRPVRALASELMEKDTDQHVTVTVTDPRDPEVAPATAPHPLQFGTDLAGTANVKALLDQLQRGSGGGGGRQPAFTGQVTSIYDMVRSTPATGAAAAPHTPGFSGNVQSLLGQLSAPARQQLAQPMLVPAALSAPAFQPMPAFPGLQLAPFQMFGAPPGAMPPVPYDIGAPLGYGKGKGVPLFTPPGSTPISGFGPKGEPLRGKGFAPSGWTGGRGPPSKGGAPGKGVSKGGGKAVDPVAVVPVASDGVPRTDGPEGPVYPWQR